MGRRQMDDVLEAGDRNVRNADRVKKTREESAAAISSVSAVDCDSLDV